MMFYVRDPQKRFLARQEFVADCARVCRGQRARRALETDIYVSNVCNIRCHYCYFYFEPYFDHPSHHHPGTPTLDQLRLLVDRLSGKIYCLVLLGGEPLTRPDLPEFLEYARQKDIFAIRISTNGLLLKKRKEILELVDILAISFDAMRSKQYPNEASRLLSDLSDLKMEYGDSLPKIIPSWTTSPADDFDRDVRPLLDFSLRHGFVVKFLPLKVNQTADWEKQRTIVSRAIEYAGADAITNQLSHTLLLEDSFGGRNCLVEGNQFYIDYQGQFLYPCDEYAHQKVGSVYDEDIDSLYQRGVEQMGSYPRKEGVCAHCPSGCHSDNSFILRHPDRQLRWLE